MQPKPLTQAELAVMEQLWDAERLTARDLRERLYPDAEKPQHGTVQRLLQRLESKGYVVRDRSFSSHLFCAALDREAYAGKQLESLAERLTGGSMVPFLTHLVEKDRLGDDELARLRRLLDGDPEPGPNQGEGHG